MSDSDDYGYDSDDPYGDGWIIKIEVSNPSDIDALMSSEEYKNLIGS